MDDRGALRVVPGGVPGRPRPRGSRARGQLFSLDAVFAGLVIIIIVLSAGSMFAYLSEAESGGAARLELESAVRRAAAALAESPGSPADWHLLALDGVSTIGLTSGSPLRISHAKLAAFAALLDSPAERRSALERAGYLVPGGSLSVEIVELGSGAPGAVLAEAGDALTDEAPSVVRVTRYGLYNDSQVALVVRGWVS